MNRTRAVRDDAGERGRVKVAKRAARPAAQDGGHPQPWLTERWPTHRVDAKVDGVETSSREPMLDRMDGEAVCQELRVSHHAVLALHQLPNEAPSAVTHSCAAVDRVVA